MPSTKLKPSSPKSNFLLLLSAITLIVIVGGIFFGKYFSSSSQPSSLDSTSNWKTYTNSELSFKYPPDWREFSNNIVLDNSSIGLAIFLKDEPIANECMKEVSVQEINSVVIRKFTGVSTGGNCSVSDSISRGIWILPSVSTYSPALLYRYDDEDTAQAEIFFDQILSTFKFL